MSCEHDGMRDEDGQGEERSGKVLTGNVFLGFSEVA